uniref:Uncharacterized protein n=1 Tax=Roseihalotalea indica TaxID=2867963 RepID=A0AA49GN74_9BACT|nr:hypothetical protein K4G66_25280 [Tunicatimonas sp. TK19036]
MYSQPSQAQKAAQLRVKETEKKIHLTLSLPKSLSQVKWVVQSGRNQVITKLSDRSSHAPADYTYPPEVAGREIWFPVIDIALDNTFAAVATFEQVQAEDSVCINGNFWDDCRALQPQMRYETHLEHWENQLFVTSETAVLKEFSLEKISTVEPGSKTLTLEVASLADDWYGTIQAWGLSSAGQWELLDEQKLAKDKATASSATPISQLTRQTVTENLSTTVSYLLGSQNKNPLSPTYGGLYLFYDMDADTYRRSDWMWSYGPSIKVLVEAACVPELSTEYGYENLIESARLVSEASLRFQVTDAAHPAYGLVLCRYDPRTDSPQGMEGYFSPADSYFMAGWGWMPYYKATGDTRFLEASVIMTKGIGRILTYDYLIEQDYLLKAGKWKNWTMDESGFGMKGAEEVYAATQNIRHQVIGKQYIDGLLKHLEREDGLWDRTWHRNEADRADNGWPVGGERGTPVLIETKYSTRGLGWAMIGLLSSHGLLPEGEVYLQKAIRLSDHLLNTQADDGHWDFLFQGNEYESEVSAKGTALWTLLFYQLYQYTHEDRHLEAARKGLTWCINQRYLGNESEAFGGIPEINRESGVVYRRWNELVCSYTLGWFGLALLEELKVQDSAE